VQSTAYKIQNFRINFLWEQVKQINVSKVQEEEEETINQLTRILVTKQICSLSLHAFTMKDSTGRDSK
jgi:hypothetical protein